MYSTLGVLERYADSITALDLKAAVGDLVVQLKGKIQGQLIPQEELDLELEKAAGRKTVADFKSKINALLTDADIEEIQAAVMRDCLPNEQVEPHYE